MMDNGDLGTQRDLGSNLSPNSQVPTSQAGWPPSRLLNTAGLRWDTNIYGIPLPGEPRRTARTKHEAWLPRGT